MQSINSILTKCKMQNSRLLSFGIAKYKIIKTSSYLELYQYERPVAFNFVNKQRTIYQKAETGEKSVLSITRTKLTLRRLIDANANAYGEKPKMITLTYAENFQDLKASNKRFKVFIQSLQEMFQKKLKYTCVPELQERGAIHYHVIMYNMPFLLNGPTIISALWPHGHTKIENIRKVQSIGHYLSSYLTKDNINNSMFFGEKLHFSSRGLYKPITMYRENLQDFSISDMLCVYENHYMSERNGLVNYKQLI